MYLVHVLRLWKRLGLKVIMKSRRLKNVMGEIQRQHHIQAMARTRLAAFSQTYSDSQKQEAGRKI